MGQVYTRCVGHMTCPQGTPAKCLMILLPDWSTGRGGSTQYDALIGGYWGQAHAIHVFRLRLGITLGRVAHPRCTPAVDAQAASCLLLQVLPCLYPCWHCSLCWPLKPPIADGVLCLLLPAVLLVRLSMSVPELADAMLPHAFRCPLVLYLILFSVCRVLPAVSHPGT